MTPTFQPLLETIKTFSQEPEVFTRLSRPPARQAISALHTALTAATPDKAADALRLIRLACGEFGGLKRRNPLRTDWIAAQPGDEEDPHFLLAQFLGGRVPLPTLLPEAADPRRPRQASAVERAATAVLAALKPSAYLAATGAGRAYLKRYAAHAAQRTRQPQANWR